MKFTFQLLVLIFGVFLSGCKIYNKGYLDVYGDFANYNDNLSCEIFKNTKCAVDYKHYNPRRCINIQYAFSAKEYKKLKVFYKKVAGFGKYTRRGGKRKKIKNSNCILLDIAFNNRIKLVNRQMYGLYSVSGYGTTPFFFFLRTENGLYFSYCKDGIDYYIDALNDSSQIEEPLKKEIINFINLRCQTDDGLRWFQGGRWY